MHHTSLLVVQPVKRQRSYATTFKHKHGTSHLTTVISRNAAKLVLQSLYAHCGISRGERTCLSLERAGKFKCLQELSLLERRMESMLGRTRCNQDCPRIAVDESNFSDRHRRFYVVCLVLSIPSRSESITHKVLSEWLTAL